MQKRTVSMLILIIVTIIPFFQNTKEITLYFFFWNFNVQGHFLFLGILLFGIIFGFIFAKIESSKQSIKKAKKMGKSSQNSSTNQEK